MALQGAGWGGGGGAVKGGRAYYLLYTSIPESRRTGDCKPGIKVWVWNSAQNRYKGDSKGGGGTKEMLS